MGCAVSCDGSEQSEQLADESSDKKNEDEFVQRMSRFVTRLQIVYSSASANPAVDDSDMLNGEFQSIWENVCSFQWVSPEFLEAYKPRYGPSKKVEQDEKNVAFSSFYEKTKKKVMKPAEHKPKRIISYSAEPPFKLGRGKATHHHHHHYHPVYSQDLQDNYEIDENFNYENGFNELSDGAYALE